MQSIQDLLQTYPERESKVSSVARKISRSQLKAYTRKVANDQGGKCAICTRPLDFTVIGQKSAVVCDHSHTTGLIRGALCRGCNGLEGKINTAVATWGKVGFNDSVGIVTYLLQLCAYLLQTPHPAIYPDHKTVEEKAALTKQKANRAAAVRAAKLKLRKQNAI